MSLYFFAIALPIEANHHWWPRHSLLRSPSSELPIEANIHLRQGS